LEGNWRDRGGSGNQLGKAGEFSGWVKLGKAGDISGWVFLGEIRDEFWGHSGGGFLLYVVSFF